MGVSIIIAYHNEGKEFLLQTIDNIETTIDVSDYEIIVVDDCSDKRVKIDGVHIIRHMKNLGVGAAFDSGVAFAKYENLFLMGCDIRFQKNEWASLMLKEVNNEPKALICSSVVPLSHEYQDIDMATAKKFLKHDLHRGAEILFFIGDDETPHHIIEARWYPREFLPLRRPDFVMPGTYEVMCILGAFYGVKKSWYRYIDGFWGHRFWGTLEPLISLKSWLFGGKCLVTPKVETGHYFKAPFSTPHASQDKYNTYKSFNRLLTANLLFPADFRDELISWLPDEDFVKKAKGMIATEIVEIAEKREEYRRKTVFSIDDLINKFDAYNPITLYAPPL